MQYTIERAAYTAAAQKLTQPLDTKIVTNFDQLTTAGKPKSGTDYAVIYTYTQPMIYLADDVTLPKDPSWDFLWDPSMKGKVFLNSNFDVLTFAVTKMLGIDPDKVNVNGGRSRPVTRSACPAPGWCCTSRSSSSAAAAA